MSAHAADQNSGLRKIILVLLALGVVSMLSLIIAGATSLISLADRIHPVAGTVVFWGHLSGSRIFCAVLRDRLRAVAASTRAAEGNVRTEARGVFAGIALATGK